MKARSFLYGWMMVATIGLVSLSLALLNAMTEVGQSVVIAEAAVNTTNTTGPNGTNITATAGAAGRTMFLSVCLIMSLGALGAQIQALISFADFVGNKQFKPSWTFFYLKRPFVGATIALLTFAALRGGFADDVVARNLSSGGLWGTIAVSLVAGLFSRQAMDKIGKIFEVMFSGTRRERRDGLERATGPQTPSLEAAIPSKIKRGEETELTLSGGPFTEDTMVFLGELPLEATFVSETSISALVPGTSVGEEEEEVLLIAATPGADPEMSEPLEILIED